MSALLDTSMLVRYLTGDPPDLADQAAGVIDQEGEVLVTDVILAETAYVLTSVYRVPRAAVVDHLILFIQKENIQPFAQNKSHVLQGLLFCQPSGRVSFADALIWAAAQGTDEKIVYSFDERFSADGVEIRRGK